MGRWSLLREVENLEVSRFPGWKIHLQRSIYSGDILMVAVRASDGKRLTGDREDVVRTAWRSGRDGKSEILSARVAYQRSHVLAALIQQRRSE